MEAIKTPSVVPETRPRGRFRGELPIHDGYPAIPYPLDIPRTSRHFEKQNPPASFPRVTGRRTAQKPLVALPSSPRAHVQTSASAARATYMARAYVLSTESKYSSPTRPPSDASILVPVVDMFELASSAAERNAHEPSSIRRTQAAEHVRRLSRVPMPLPFSAREKCHRTEAVFNMGNPREIRPEH
jgi:hypothetical protein